MEVLYLDVSKLPPPEAVIVVDAGSTDGTFAAYDAKTGIVVDVSGPLPKFVDLFKSLEAAPPLLQGGIVATRWRRQRIRTRP